ncbi:MAG: DUF5995 family protein [Pseudonocardia sp.]
MSTGSTQELARIASKDVQSIADVVQRLEDIRDHAAATSLLGAEDGIASFTKLYHIITKNVEATAAAGQFADVAFLTRLDIEFARRYFSALRAYAVNTQAAPQCWRILFDRRSDRSIRPVHFAAAGVNAHVNFDLTPALLATWEAFPPDDQGVQHADYRRINDIFAVEMDDLRELFGSVLSVGEDGALWDRFANRASDLLVRFTRDLAWDEALEVWGARDRGRARRSSGRKLDAIAEILGRGLLEAPFLPV